MSYKIVQIFLLLLTIPLLASTPLSKFEEIAKLPINNKKTLYYYSSDGKKQYFNHLWKYAVFNFDKNSPLKLKNLTTEKISLKIVNQKHQLYEIDGINSSSEWNIFRNKAAKQGLKALPVVSYGASPILVRNRIGIYFNKNINIDKNVTLVEKLIKLKLKKVEGMPEQYFETLPLLNRGLFDTANKIFESGLVKWAQPVTVQKISFHAAPDDKYYSQQWHLEMANVEPAWNYSKGNYKIKIAVIDSGVESSHPDLAGNITTGRNFSAPPISI